MALEYVQGKNAGHIVLYALSTCPWCRKTRQLLDDMGVEYYYTYVDQLLPGDEKDNAIKTIERWNPNRSFPTLVINDSTSIAGFRENEIRETLKT